MKKGFLYILSNNAHPGWLKIGCTEDIKSRLHVYQVGDPQRKYKMEFYISCKNCFESEIKIKEAMKYFATRQKNEWFECTLPVAIVRLQEQVECEP